MKIGILGPGSIAEKMAYTINHMKVPSVMPLRPEIWSVQRHLQKNLTFLRRMALMKNWQRPGCGIDLYCGTPFPSLYVYENVSGTWKTCIV